LDLSFTDFDDRTEVVVLPADLSTLMIGIAARQAASATAHMQLRCAGSTRHRTLLEPLDGAFNGPMAAALIRWKDE
jgi:hypothetical protein